MLTAKELRAQANAAIQAAEEAQNRAAALAAQARAAEQAEVQERAKTQAAHSGEMFEKHGYELTRKQHDFIYAKAYEDRRSDGETGIENQYAELAELARMILGSASYF